MNPKYYDTTFLDSFTKDYNIENNIKFNYSNV